MEGTSHQSLTKSSYNLRDSDIMERKIKPNPAHIYMQDGDEVVLYENTWERWSGDEHGSHFDQELATWD